MLLFILVKRRKMPLLRFGNIDHRNSVQLIVLFCFSACIFSSCKNAGGNAKKSEPEITKDSTDNLVQKLVITYHYDTIRNDSALKVFKSTYSTTQQKIIAAANRIDVNKIRVKSTLVIPDTLMLDFIQYSPFPELLPNAETIPKFILINQRIQLFAAYENGKIVQFGPVSTGRKSKQTPNKLYYTNFKAKKKRSTVDGDWIMPWYFNISNFGGIGMHQYTLPGYPASHSCIRMYEENAFWIFNWADQWVLSEDGTTVAKPGTPVLIFGNYDFEQISPWKLLPQQPNAIDLTEEEQETIKNTIAELKKSAV
jgi:lipoprotein-anchoring transpeptidase ErfK/SrfK